MCTNTQTVPMVHREQTGIETPNTPVHTDTLEMRGLRGYCVHVSMELGPEHASVLERCPH